jgi:CRP/FNR family transcriptional regulator, cyclic AMP receptor protein
MIPLDTLVSHLGKTKLFASLAPADLMVVAQSMRAAEFGAGQVIFQRGDAGKDVFLVISGRVRLSILSVDGRELSFAHATDGHVFGEIATLDGGVRSADATAVTKVSAMTLSQTVLNRLIEENKAVTRAVIAFLCGRIRDTDQQLEAIALHPIEVRLARLFLSAIRLQAGTPKTGKVMLALGMSQSDLGLLIGASRPKVNGALAMLEDSGAISRSDQGILCDLEQLLDVAGVD